MKSLSRRKILGQAGALGAACTVGPRPASADQAPEAKAPGREKRRLKLIVTGGHPGDPEYGCGGTIARYTDLGH